MKDSTLRCSNYWSKLQTLHLYSQERRRERYMIICIWKISQGLVSGYSVPFTCRSSRTGRTAVPAKVLQSAPTTVKNTMAVSLGVKGAKLFNLLPTELRNSDHGDILMFKNHLDIFLQNIPDEPTHHGRLDQVPHYEAQYK